MSKIHYLCTLKNPIATLMSDNKRIKTALVSVFYKDGLEEILSLLNSN